MIQDAMIGEIQELKLSGYTPKEVHEELKKRHVKVPTLKTVRKYYNMDCAPEDNHARVRKPMAFDCEPFRSEVIEIAERNPDAYMSSIYDVLVEKFVEGGEYEELSFPLDEDYHHGRKEEAQARRVRDPLGWDPRGGADAGTAHRAR